jgi:hypothetical protein
MLVHDLFKVYGFSIVFLGAIVGIGMVYTALAVVWVAWKIFDLVLRWV